MESLIFLFWFLCVIFFPVSFLVTSYISFIKGNQAFDIVLRLSVAFIIYVCITAACIPFVFVLIYAGAHSDPVGNALDAKGKLIYLTGLLIYMGSGWLLCSFINGKLIKPWALFHSNKEQSEVLLNLK